MEVDDDGSGVDNWKLRCTNLQSNRHRQETDTRHFTGQMPFLLPNHVRAVKGKALKEGKKKWI